MSAIRILIVLIAAIVMAAWASGCIVAGRNQGEYGFRTGTEFTWFHRTAQTAEVEDRAELSTTLISGPLVSSNDAEAAPPATPPTP